MKYRDLSLIIAGWGGGMFGGAIMVMCFESGDGLLRGLLGGLIASISIGYILALKLGLIFKKDESRKDNLIGARK